MNFLSFIKRIFTLPQSTKVILQHIIDPEIDSIFAHNTPEQITGKLYLWVSQTPIGNNALAGTAAALAIGSLQQLLAANETDAAKAKFKIWVYGRLGIN